MTEPVHIGDATLYCADCRDILPTLEPVETCITDPPYGISFMGKEWDHGVPGRQFWEALKLKPGGLLLAFGGTRTFHRLTCAIEDAGYEIRDCLMWLYGSGFPKSHDISKAIDKAAGEDIVTRGHIGFASGEQAKGAFRTNEERQNPGVNKHKAITPDAQLWDGWGTALKPAWEPIIVAMQPLDGTFADNALKHGVAGLNIDECRIEATKEDAAKSARPNSYGKQYKSDLSDGVCKMKGIESNGRFPANVIHDGSDEILGGFPDTKSGKLQPHHKTGTVGLGIIQPRKEYNAEWGGDFGPASRFFKECPQEELCELCFTPKHDTMSAWKTINVNTADSSSGNTQVIKGNTVPLSAEDLLDAKSVQLVRYAGNLCDLCGTSIVQGLVEIKNSDSKNEGSLAIRDFIGNYRKCILLQNLASYVEQMDNIDTTPTTTNLLKLFGYVLPAIKSYIQKTKRSAPKRFGYFPKASKSERNAGCHALDEVRVNKLNSFGNQEDFDCPDGAKRVGDKGSSLQRNFHPTVKPVALMRYLCMLTSTPTGGTVIDPFMGSGSTGVACARLGRKFIGIEISEPYFRIACERIDREYAQGKMF